MDRVDLEDGELDSAPIPMTRVKSVRPPVLEHDDLEELDGVVPRARPHAVRRFLIRLIGFAAVGGVIWGAFQIARQPRARAEMAAWGTMGNPKLATTAARGVRSVVDTVRSLGK